MAKNTRNVSEEDTRIIDVDAEHPQDPEFQFEPMDEEVIGSKRVRREKKRDERIIVHRKPKEGLPPIGRSVRWAEFEEWIHKLTPEQWQRINCYCYRLYPVVDLTLVDPKSSKNIDKFSGPFTREDIVERHGGGRYKFVVSELGVPSPRSGVTTCILEIPETEAEPKIDYRTLVVDHEFNKQYVKRLRQLNLISDDNKIIPPQDPVTATSVALQNVVTTLAKEVAESKDKEVQRFERMVEKLEKQKEPTEEIFSKALDLITQASQKGNELIIEQLKGQDPIKMLGVTMELLKGLKGGETQALEVFKMMMEVQKEDARRREELLIKVLEKNQKEGDEDDKFIAKLEKLRTLQSIFGKEGKVGTLELVLGNIDKILMPFAQIMQSIALMKSGMQGVQGVSGMPQLPLTGAVTPVEGLKGLTETPVRGVAEQPQQQGGLDPMKQQLMQAVKMFEGRIMEAILHDESGVDFAVSLASLYGEQTYLMVASMGKEKIMEVVKGLEIWNKAGALGLQGKLEKFVEEFVSAKDMKDEDEEE